MLTSCDWDLWIRYVGEHSIPNMMSLSIRDYIHGFTDLVPDKQVMEYGSWTYGGPIPFECLVMLQSESLWKGTEER